MCKTYLKSMCMPVHEQTDTWEELVRYDALVVSVSKILEKVHNTTFFFFPLHSMPWEAQVVRKARNLCLKRLRTGDHTESEHF